MPTEDEHSSSAVVGLCHNIPETFIYMICMQGAVKAVLSGIQLTGKHLHLEFSIFCNTDAYCSNLYLYHSGRHVLACSRFLLKVSC